MITALVTGSHTRGVERHVWHCLDLARIPHRFDFLVCGGADYVDSFVISWCLKRKVSFAVLYAEWEKYGNAAGVIRNERMLTKFKPDMVLAFPGDAGTTNMKALARAAGIPVHEYVS